jgi:hypothetical protein
LNPTTLAEADVNTGVVVEAGSTIFDAGLNVKLPYTEVKFAGIIP